MKAIFSKLMYEMADGHDTVLVTLVKDRGSAPRSAGARMLVSKYGRQVGTIGGGGLEFNAEKMALELLAAKKSLLHEYRLRPNAEEDLGVVCGGDVTVLFQFIPHDHEGWKTLAEAVISKLNAHEEGWLLLPLDGSCARLLSQKPEEKTLAETAYAMPLPVGERVFVFGAGHVAMALCPILESVGFRVTIVDNRPEYANKINFPKAESIILADMNRLKDFIAVTEKDYLVIMTSGHTYDFIVEKQVLTGPFAYVGVMGSRKKTLVVNEMLHKEGISEEATSKVHTPIGLAIGATTPEELAVSIAGELIRIRAEKR